MLTYFPVNDVGAIGIVVDRPPHELPFNAWTSGRNVRMLDGRVEKILGHLQVFNPPSIAPYFLQTLWSAGTNYWLYPGLLKVYVWNGTVHTNITRQTAAVDVDYGATADENWTGGLLGNVPVLNNGVDDPQQWLPVSVATKLEALSNWPASTKCKALRVFKQYLVAMNVTKSGTAYPQMVKWSHRAGPNAVPTSWDETDETIDAAEFNLTETNGAVVDCLPLGDLNIVYKEDSSWGMQYVGGIQVFRFFDIFKTLGLLTKRAVVEIPGRRHVVFGLDDVLVHNGQSAESILDSRMRRWLFSSIDSTYYKRCFLAHNNFFKEVWICFPETGSTLPNKAIVWNYARNTTAVRDLPSIAHIESGSVNPDSDNDQWSDASGSWDSDTQAWGERTFNPTQRKLMMAQPSGPKLFYADAGNTENGTAMTSYIERIGLGVPVKQDGPPDIVTEKFFGRIWPRFTGTSGTMIKVRAGVQEVADGPVFWQPEQNFTLGEQNFFNVQTRGRLLAVRFESSADAHWALHGYQIETRAAGRYNG